MDDSSSKAVQYWTQVYNIGCVVFRDVAREADSLKMLLNIVINSPLLSEIECLSTKSLRSTTCPCPITTWLLQGIFIAATENSGDKALEELCIQSQSKLLTAALQRTAFEYSYLLKKYFSAIKMVMTANIGHTFCSFIHEDCFVNNLTLTAQKVTMTNEQLRVRFLKLLYRVMEGTRLECIKGCIFVDIEIWDVIMRFHESQVGELSILTLQLMKGLILTGNLPDDQVLFRVFSALPHMFLTNILEVFNRKDLFFEIWSLLKKQLHLNSADVESVINNLMFYKNNCCIDDFIPTEIGYLLHEYHSSCSIPESLLQYTEWPLQEQSLIIENFIVKDILIANPFSEKRTDSNVMKFYNASTLSKHWREFVPKVVVIAERPRTAQGRIKCISMILTVCMRVLSRLNQSLFQNNSSIQFFGDEFKKILFCIRQHFDEPGFCQIACIAFSDLMNLPEASLLNEIDSREPMRTVINLLDAPPSFVDGQDRVNLLYGLRNIPAGIQTRDCVKIFVNYLSNSSTDLDCSFVAVESVPYLFMTGKTSPSQLIADILMPAILSDNEELCFTALDSVVRLVCAVAGSVIFVREEDELPMLKCRECDMGLPSTRSQNDLEFIEFHLNQLFEPLFNGTPRNRCRLLATLSKITMHSFMMCNEAMLKRCLTFLRDPNAEVRRELANSITSFIFGRALVMKGKQSLISDEDINKEFLCVVKSALNMTFAELEEVINLQINAWHWGDGLENLITTVVNIASFPYRAVLKDSLSLLLLFMGTCSTPLFNFVSTISGFHNTTPAILYCKYRPEISELYGRIIVRNQQKFGCPARVTLSSFFFKGLPKVRFAAGSGQYILPTLVVAAAKEEQLKVLLFDYAEYFEVPLPTVLTKLFPCIYAHIWIHESPDIFKKSMDLIEKTIAVNIPDLVLHTQKMIIHQLLFNYHYDQEKVLQGLSQIIGSLSQHSNKEKIASSLESRFVGYLLFLVGKFTKEESAESEQVQALQSLTAVLKLMGRAYITPVARKVLATLMTMNNLDHYRHATILCNAWDCFVRTIEPKELGPLLATTVYSILQLLTHAEERVVEMLRFILVEKKQEIREFIPKLIFIKNQSPALEEIVDNISELVTFKNEHIKERLARETALATHETVGVRVEGLKALLETLKTVASDVQSLIIGSDEADQCITSLLDALVMGCRDSDLQISSIAASCLGELGAVDPSLLPRLLKSKNDLPLSAHDRQFGYLSLRELLRGFQNARTSVHMDAFAIGIQEVLKIYSVTETEDNEVWQKFSQGEQSLLRPMLSSRYTVQAPVRSSWPDIIFGAREAGSYISWAALWASKLIAVSTDKKAVVLFRACEPSMKRDPKILLFFLKYILLHVITQNKDSHNDILKEIEAVINFSSDNKQSQDCKRMLPVRMIEYGRFPSIQTSISDADARACSLTVFLLIDFLNYWTRSYLSIHHTQTNDHLRKRDYVLVKDFLSKINLKLSATVNLELQEYPRAVQFIEDMMRNDESRRLEFLPLLSKMYALYGDLDSMAGARTLQQSTSSIEEQIFYHQMSGQLEEVRILYEQLGKRGDMSLNHVTGMVQCYLKLGEPTAAYGCINGQIQKPGFAVTLSESLVQCMLQLGDWEAVSNYLTTDLGANQRNWNTQIGRITHNIREGLLSEVNSCLTTTRSDLIRNFTALGSESGNEQHGYHYLVRFHILNEVEGTRNILALNDPKQLQSNIQSLFQEWDAKLNLVQSGGDFIEQILCTRRILLAVMSKKLPTTCSTLIDEQLGKYWVKSAEVARKAGCFHQAYNYIISAEQYNIPLTFIEKSKLLWEKGKKEDSIATLTNGMSVHFPSAANLKTLQSGEKLEERKMAAEALLLYAMYNEETSNCSSSTNKSNYQDAYEMCKELEKTQALLAQCVDRCLSLMTDSDEDERKACEYRVTMVNYFGKSLLHGCEYIYQTVPRMLSVWFDLGENLSSPERTNAMATINRLIKAFLEKLPPFVFMTALPQLLSRIGHPNREVYSLLKSIIVHLIRAFPQQCLWAIQTLAKSSVHERSFRYKEMIQDPALQADGLFKLIQHFTSLCDKLNRLTNVNLPQDSTSRCLLVSNVVRDLPLLFKSGSFSPIIVPITRFLAISLPKDVTSSIHQPFPKNAVTIAGIRNEMAVLPSLQRPRKISFLGSDGKLYDILCKPKDDLRRDARLMEFNNIVNMYLHRDPECRKRQLHIRTYVVTPLGESGGLLEWVPQLVGLRPALFQLYKQYGKFVSPRDIRKFDTDLKDPLTKKREIFLDKLLPAHPPIFQEWFRLNFPDPARWYAARLAYIRTTAVMSMVGYILGLGDRHGENILFDCESGDTVHVDFNCLFNKGEHFLYKERVPFRLTHNMVAAMGPCGVEGAFRKSCEMSMRVLRAQGKTLMSVLTPSAYDPFGSWGKNKQINHQERDQKIAEALEELSDIEKRLNGSLRVKQKNGTFYLSVEGLVRTLIDEALSVDNLCQMYLGWGAYL